MFGLFQCQIINRLHKTSLMLFASSLCLHKKKRKKRPSLEYYCVHNHEDQIDHLAFFNYFIHLNRRNVMTRFNDLVKNCISDETRKREVEEKYKTWRKSNEAKVYWSEREARQRQLLLRYQSESGPSVIESVAGSSVTSSFGTSDSTASVGMDSNEVMQLIESNMIPINNKDTFKINDVNVLQRFHDFQKSLGTSPLTYKSQIHHILATSGILLVKNHQHPDLLKFIDCKTTSMMLKNTYEQIGLYSQKFSRDTFVQSLEIVQECISEKITTIKATQQLLALIDEESNSYQNKVILCFKSLLEQLPDDPFEAKELELTPRLIQPLLQPLFEDRAEKIYLRWIDTQTEEYKKDGINCSNKRPDGCITQKAYEDINLGFIEVKEEKQQNDKSKLNKDLHKLGVFSKNAIEQNHLRGVLCIQVVGKL